MAILCVILICAGCIDQYSEDDEISPHPCESPSQTPGIPPESTPEWKQIWLGESGILQGILDTGFDGVYLDWIEAYSDDNVIEIAEKNGIDTICRTSSFARWLLLYLFT
jgi:hypothetical protein